MISLPFDNLKCPLCGCSSFDIKGTIDPLNQEVDENTEFTCENCGEKLSPTIFAMTDEDARKRMLLENADVPLPAYTSLDTFIDEAIHSFSEDLYYTLRDSGPKNRADALSAIYAEILRDQIKNLMTKSALNSPKNPAE